MWRGKIGEASHRMAVDSADCCLTNVYLCSRYVRDYANVWIILPGPFGASSSEVPSALAF
jgi:hypothetical protein